jgi:TRAP-type mannitol/chloroaromatic compound transport system permease small subunit
VVPGYPGAASPGVQSLLQGEEDLTPAGPSAPATDQGPLLRLIRALDQLSHWSGKSCAWLIVVLMLAVAVEVFKRYVLNAPTAWIFDLTNMLYGTLFMLCGAYALAQNAHVRADFIYIHLRPRVQAGLDLALYLLFFMPGILALIYAGYGYAADSWRIGEHSTVTADGPPIYPFKSVIPVAGALVMLQGVAEVLRCLSCLKSGRWPARPKDVAEIDVVETQLAQSEFVGAEERAALGSAHVIDELARQRGRGASSAAGNTGEAGKT